MATVVRIVPNGLQSLLTHDNAIGDIVAQGWHIFIKRFEGYNLTMAHDLS
jgi:hypothetical protein